MTTYIPKIGDRVKCVRGKGSPDVYSLCEDTVYVVAEVDQWQHDIKLKRCPEWYNSNRFVLVEGHDIMNDLRDLIQLGSWFMTCDAVRVDGGILLYPERGEVSMEIQNSQEAVICLDDATGDVLINITLSDWNNVVQSYSDNTIKYDGHTLEGLTFKTKGVI